MEELKKKILEKKELRGLSLDFLDKYLEEYKRKKPKEYRILEQKKFNEKSKEFDDIKKFIRKHLREVHGVFSKEKLSEEKKEKYLDFIKIAIEEKNQFEEQKITRKILESHQSTYERIIHYEELYNKILEKIEDKDKIKKIVDFGCGYNPFSYSYIEHLLKNKIEYVCIDINDEDMLFIKKYLEIKKVKNKTITCDLTSEEELKKIEKYVKDCDLCFMFKLLDSLESKKRGSSDCLLKKINSEVIIVSFPLKTISGKNEIKGRRKWFERIIKINEFKTEQIIIGEEIYYILTK